MLEYSISSFKRWYGDSHKYILYTDNVESIPVSLKNIAQVKSFFSENKSMFDVKSKATWLKWCPKSRINIDETEFYIDSDVFLVKYPKEIENFLNDDSLHFAILDEFEGESWQHGAMKVKASPDTPFINAGLFIQKKNYDITPDLAREFEWWLKNISYKNQTHHDEQGSLAIALTPYLRNGSLLILPKEKYALISDHQNLEIKSLDNIDLFHATWPEHPAFYRFKLDLNKIIYGEQNR
ncbi:MAG: hypothetical protein NTU81_03650 [Candidatus Nomurabacteria bacterium]|nr:hypothetical protein [Candidatus Nomurabacteria bacterium]